MNQELFYTFRTYYIVMLFLTLVTFFSGFHMIIFLGPLSYFKIKEKLK